MKNNFYYNIKKYIFTTLNYINIHGIDSRQKKYSFIIDGPLAFSGHARRIAEILIAKSPDSLITFYCTRSNYKRVIKVWIRSNNIKNVNVKIFLHQDLFYLSNIIFITHAMPKTIHNYQKFLIAHKTIMIGHGILVKVPKDQTEPVGWEELPKLWVSSGPHETKTLVRKMRMSKNNILEIGSARSDYLYTPINELPPDIKKEIYRLQEIKGLSKLIIFAPTWNKFIKKNSTELFVEECNYLGDVFKSFNVKLAVRVHPNLSRSLKPRMHNFSKEITLLSPSEYPNTESVLHAADILITDYSSIWTDFLVMDKTIISVNDNSYYYDKTIFKYFPGFKFSNQYELGNFIKNYETIEELIENCLAYQAKFSHKSKNSLYGNNLDGKAAERLVQNIIDGL